jgi:tripartite-type tricarboxylate transporter receptor subunit TctC
MTRPIRLALFAAFAAITAALVAVAPGAHAQAFPAKPVRLVLGAPPGTAPDAAARIISERLSALWGQPVVVDNKPGVGGMLAMEQVKGAPADGHTLMFAHAGAVVVTPKFLKVAKYNPVTEFSAIGYVADSPIVIVAGPSAQDKTLPGLLKRARSEPGKLAVGSTEQATLPYLLGHAVAQAGNATFLHVPFNQPGQASQALMNGDVQYAIDGVAPLLPLIKAGRISAVAAATDRVLPGLEGVPLVKDTLPGLVAVGWFALLGPKDMPAELVTRINRDLNAVLAQDDVATRLRDVSLFVNPKSVSQTQAFLVAEIETWAATIKKAGIEPN